MRKTCLFAPEESWLAPHSEEKLTRAQAQTSLMPLPSKAQPQANHHVPVDSIVKNWVGFFQLRVSVTQYNLQNIKKDSSLRFTSRKIGVSRVIYKTAGEHCHLNSILDSMQSQMN